MSSKLKWWQRPVRMMRRDYIGAFEQFMQSDLEALARESKERWHINCEWVMATPGCSPGLSYQTLFNSAKFEKFPRLGDFDMVREYLPHAKKHGVHLMPYVNMHWYSYAFAAQHPGWEQVLEDGTAYGRKNPLYGDGTTLCVNGPWRDWAFEMIREVMRTGVDGCFLDGPVVYPECCYCESCRALWAKASGGKRIPSWKNWGDPQWKRFLQFRAESWSNFMRDAQAAATEINPEAAIFLNGGHFDSFSMDLAHDPGRMERFQTFTGSEEFFHCATSYNAPFKALNLARFLSAGEKPAVVFTHHTLSTWHYVPLPKAEMTAALAMTAAGGANPWFAIFMDAMTSRAKESFDAVHLCRFFERNEEYYTATRSAAETAVLLSNRTLYYYISRHRALARQTGSLERNLIVTAGSEQVRQDLAALRQTSTELLDREHAGCLDALTFNHIPLRALWDEHLTPQKLKGVKTLVLPNAACLSDAQIKAVRAFVEAGGGLVASFETGMYDEWGDPAERPHWLNFLGIEKVEGALLPSRYEDYLHIATDRLEGFAKGLIVARPLNGLLVRPTPDAEPLAYFYNPVNKAYLSLKGVSDHPAATFMTRGKGRVVYLASPLFESFDQFHIADHQALAKAAIRLAAGRAGLQVETDAPASLAVELRAQKGRTLLHLVNVTGEMKRPLDRIIPLRNVEIALRSGKVKRIKALRSGKELPFSIRAGRLRVRVPLVNDYELLAIE